MTEHAPADWFVASLSMLVPLSGVAVGWTVYGTGFHVPAFFGRVGGPFAHVSRREFYLREGLSVAIAWPLSAAVTLCRMIDRLFIDGLPAGFVSRVAALIAGLVQRLERGSAHSYAHIMVVALAMLVALVAAIGAQAGAIGN